MSMSSYRIEEENYMLPCISPSIVKFLELWSNIPYQTKFVPNLDNVRSPQFRQIDNTEAFSLSLLNIVSSSDLVMKIVGYLTALASREIAVLAIAGVAPCRCSLVTSFMANIGSLAQFM